MILSQSVKDAQAAIYGTIGANGVILITTKTEKEFEI
jgi:TonB-dependent SusC/RagA subfamily outer membrane receptor